MKVSTQILRPINFIHLTNQTGGILHSPPTPTQGGSSSSTLVMCNNKFIPVINVNHWKGLGMEWGMEWGVGGGGGGPKLIDVVHLTFDPRVENIS